MNHHKDVSRHPIHPSKRRKERKGTQRETLHLFGGVVSKGVLPLFAVCLIVGSGDVEVGGGCGVQEGERRKVTVGLAAAGLLFAVGPTLECLMMCFTRGEAVK